MKTFIGKFTRDFEVAFEVENLEAAETAASAVLQQFPTGTCKLLSIFAEDYVEHIEPVKDGGPVDSTAVRNAGLAKRVHALTDQPSPEAA